MSAGAIYGDTAALTESNKSFVTGDDSITVSGDLSAGNIYGDVASGFGNDTITVGGVGNGATGGTITDGEGNDKITIFVGDAGSKGNLIIDANGMHVADESIVLHYTDTEATHVSITNLSNAQDYETGSFTVNTTDITGDVNQALDNGDVSLTHGGLVIYFS